jgi:hypothetical protein
MRSDLIVESIKGSLQAAAIPAMAAPFEFVAA